MVKLVIIWETGEKEEHLYNTKEEAERIEKGMHMAFGKQISWTGIVEEMGNIQIMTREEHRQIHEGWKSL